MESGFVFLAMWLVPPALFVLTGMFMVYYKGWISTLDDNPFITNNKEKGEDKTHILCLFGFLFPIIALGCYGLVLNLYRKSVV